VAAVIQNQNLSVPQFPPALPHLPQDNLGDLIMFDEQKLYQEIIRIWGYYGAHADVFRTLYIKANPGSEPDWFHPLKQEPQKTKEL
jgi:hypothetical protein